MNEIVARCCTLHLMLCAVVCVLGGGGWVGWGVCVAWTQAAFLSRARPLSMLARPSADEAACAQPCCLLTEMKDKCRNGQTRGSTLEPPCSLKLARLRWGAVTGTPEQCGLPACKLA